MVSLPLFSIITPVRNVAQKLGSTHDSLLNQASDLYEWIVVDGASSDKTTEWLEAHHITNLRWNSEPDQGVYDAMNKGVKMARGQFLLFLGAGDRLLPGALQAMAEFIHQKPTSSPRLIYGNVKYLDTGLPFTEGQFTKTRLCFQNICHQGIFYENTIFKKWGGYELTYPILADWAFNLRCFGDSSIAKLHFNQPVAAFEGGGLCAHTPDVVFAHDRQRLINERLGPYFAWQFRLTRAVKRKLKRAKRLNFR